MNGQCPGDPPDPGSCWYPAHNCPLHAPRPVASEPEAIDWGDEGVHALARAALQAAVRQEATPLQLSRFMRSLRILNALGPPPLDEERALAEVALRGALMNGLAPRTQDEWELAREIFNEDTMQDLYQRLAREMRFAGEGAGRFIPDREPHLERT